MKKTLILSTFLAFAFQAFAYTQTDFDNATYLSQKGIIKTQTTPRNYRLDDKILRQEVIAMALTIKGIKIPDSYRCKKYFSDVVQNDWVCRAIELAADEGMISRLNPRARSQDFITRAEALAIVMKASGEMIGMGGGSGYKYYFDSNLYTEGGIGYKDAYSFGATWQAETFYQYIRNIIANDAFLQQNPLPNNYATRAEVFSFAKNILGKNTQLQKEIIIENNNVVLYEKGKKVKNLTTDGDNVLSPNGTCENPDEFNQYKMLGQANGFFIVSHTVGLCETDSSHQDILIFDGVSLVNLVTKIKQKFDVQLGYGVIGIVEVKNNQIRVFGEFSYSSGCVDLGCPVYISQDKITSLGVHVIKKPVGNISGEFEFFFDPSILF